MGVQAIAGTRHGGQRNRGRVWIGMTYESVKEVESKIAPGVRFRIARMSFARRVDLMRQVRELARRMEFLEAGREPGETMDSTLIQVEVNRLYLMWGLIEVAGLEVDGAAATPASLEIGRAHV